MKRLEGLFLKISDYILTMLAMLIDVRKLMLTSKVTIPSRKNY